MNYKNKSFQAFAVQYFRNLIFCMGCFPFIFCGCKKTGFLDTKPAQNLVVPATLDNFQALLDNDQYMNGAGLGLSPALGEVGSDDYFLQDGDYNSSLTQYERNEYIWAASVYPGQDIQDWDYPYRAVFYANLALEGVQQINPTSSQQKEWNNIRGSALFYRSYMFFQMTQIFSEVYDSATAPSSFGIPLRLSSDVNEKITRATMQETYQQIINDTRTAASLLPITPLYKTRPSSVAAYGLLSRIYLSMSKYDSALLYTQLFLQQQDSLLDYNTLDSTTYYAIPRFNTEVVFHCTMLYPDPLFYNYTDSNLYNSYSSGDLRKKYFFDFFNGLPYTAKTYNGDASPFGGIATDEIYFIKAECLARAGDFVNAVTTLNTVMKKRYINSSFSPVTANDPVSALAIILKERRKELLFRGLRWMDLRRLNKEGANITPIRLVEGTIFSLLPNDPKYVYPIPDNVISFNPGMQQNPR